MTADLVAERDKAAGTKTKLERKVSSTWHGFEE